MLSQSIKIIMDCGRAMCETKIMKSVWVCHQANLAYSKDKDFIAKIKDVVEAHPNIPRIYTRDMSGWGEEWDYLLDITCDGIALISNPRADLDCDTITIPYDPTDIRQTQLRRIEAVSINLTTRKCAGVLFNDGLSWSGEAFESCWSGKTSKTPQNLLKVNGDVKKRKKKKDTRKCRKAVNRRGGGRVRG